MFLQVDIVADSFADCNKSESVGLLQHCSIRAVLPSLPAWESVNPGDIFRVFEKGGRNIINLLFRTSSDKYNVWKNPAVRIFVNRIADLAPAHAFRFP